MFRAPFFTHVRALHPLQLLPSFLKDMHIGRKIYSNGIGVKRKIVRVAIGKLFDRQRLPVQFDFIKTHVLHDQLLWNYNGLARF